MKYSRVSTVHKGDKAHQGFHSSEGGQGTTGFPHFTRKGDRVQQGFHSSQEGWIRYNRVSTVHKEGGQGTTGFPQFTRKGDKVQYNRVAKVHEVQKGFHSSHGGGPRYNRVSVVNRKGG